MKKVYTNKIWKDNLQGGDSISKITQITVKTHVQE